MENQTTNQLKILTSFIAMDQILATLANTSTNFHGTETNTKRQTPILPLTFFTQCHHKHGAIITLESEKILNTCSPLQNCGIKL